jgi:8-oxo-dGTP diphosphatase
MAHIAVVALAHLVDRKLLLVRSSNKDGFYLPGGKPEPGESDHDALAREIREELGCRIDFSNLTYFTTTVAQAFAQPDGVMVHVKTFLGRLVGIPRPMSEVAEVRFFGRGEYLAMPSRAPAAEILLGKLHDQGLVRE